MWENNDGAGGWIERSTWSMMSSIRLAGADRGAVIPEGQARGVEVWLDAMDPVQASPRPPTKGGLAASVAGQMAARSPQTFHIGTGAEAANLGFLAAQPAVLSLTHFHFHSFVRPAPERVRSALTYRTFVLFAKPRLGCLTRRCCDIGIFVTTNR